MSDDGEKFEVAEREEARNLSNNCKFIREFLNNVRDKGDDLGSESVKEIEELRGFMKDFVDAKVEIKSEKSNEVAPKREESPKEKRRNKKGGRIFGTKGNKGNSIKFKNVKRDKKEESDSSELSSSYSNTSSSSESEIRSSNDSSDESSDYENRRRPNRRSRDKVRRPRNRQQGRSATRTRRRSLDLRKLPKLEMYNEETGRDLLKYLDKFEMYCKENFRGHKDFWISELEEHLQGETLKYFKMIRDWDDDYKSVRHKLVKWYKAETKTRKKTYKKQFEKAKPKTGENIYMFSIRLASLYKSAFPNHSYDKSEVLMDRFVKVIPKDYQRAINTQKMAYGLRRRKITFTFMQNCVKLKDLDNVETLSSDSEKSVKEVEIHLGQQRRGREDYDRRGTREVTGWQNYQRRNREYSNNGKVTKNEGNNRRKDNGTYDEQREKGLCFACNEPGHFARECRISLGLCLLCGEKGHFVRACPRRKEQERGHNFERRSSYYKDNRDNNRGRSYEGGEKRYQRESDYPRSSDYGRDGSGGVIPKKKDEQGTSKGDGMNEYYDQMMLKGHGDYTAPKYDQLSQGAWGKLEENNPVERRGLN